MINVFRFRTKGWEMNRRCQINGVVTTTLITGDYDGLYPIVVENDYFRLLEQIIKLDYLQNNQ